MKYLFILLAALPFCCFSQKINYRFTNTGYLSLGYHKLSAKEYLKVNFENPQVIFETFDETLFYPKRRDTSTVNISEERFTREGFICKDNDMHLLYSVGHRSKNYKQLFAVPFNKNNKGISAGNTIELFKTESLSPDVLIQCRSNDNSRILFVYQLEKNNKSGDRKKQVLGFKLYDSKMNSLYSNEIEMAFDKSAMKKTEFRVNSNGDIFLMRTNAYRYELNESKEETGNKILTLMKINQQTNSVDKMDINIGKIASHDFNLAEGDHNSIIISGLHTNNPYKGGPRGFFITKAELDATGGLKNLNTTVTDFSIDFLKENETTESIAEINELNNKGQLGSGNLYLKELIVDKDGSAVLIAEEYYYTSPPNNGAVTHHCNEIIAAKYDKNNKLIWLKKIPKSQVGVRSGDLSYFHHTFKNEDYFLYIDHLNNLNLPINVPPTEHTLGKNGQLVYTRIDGSGNITKQIIYNMKEGDVNIYPNRFTSVGDHVILYPIEEKNQYSQTFRLDFE